MDSQELLALAIVGITAALFVVRSVRRRMRGPAPLCAGGCSCPAARGANSPHVESAAEKG